MKTILKLLACIFVVSYSQAIAQISITYPSSRAVFQRDNSNQATVYIAGYFTGLADVIEARFVKRSNGNVEVVSPETGWTTISTAPILNNFYGSIPVQGGWYQLEVRSKKNGTVTHSTNVDRVGVGEVFIVAGQSNATGSNELPAGPSAVDDRVNSVDFQNYNPSGNIILAYNDVRLPYPIYSHLSSNTKMAPFGNNAWCWGKFGDHLVNELNVPVMIFNSGWTATSSKNWKETIDINHQTFNGFGYQFPAGLPFGHLRLALNYYASILGVRAILWHQGESDNLESRSREDYRNNMRDVIAASRSLSEKADLAWVVARASRYTIDGTSRVWDPVIQAQNDLIGINGTDPSIYMPHVFQGPETDNYWLPPYRHDQVHFSGEGFDFLGELWKNHTNNHFFTNSTPYAAAPPHNIQITGDPNVMSFNLTAPAGQTHYRWSSIGNFTNTLSTASSVNVNEGNFILETKNSNNNVVLSPELRLSEISLPVHLTYFSGQAQERSNSLRWETASEKMSSHFELERSSDMRNFEKIGVINAGKDSEQILQYTFVDEKLNNDHYYYRLKMVDIDNSFEYSTVISVQNKNGIRVSVYPNPVVNELTIDNFDSIGKLEIYNTMGTKIFDEQIVESKTQINFSQLPTGLYFIKMNGRTFKVLKN